MNNNYSHVIQAVDTSWNNYAFNINDELTNLPGITPTDIAKIQVSLIAQCVDDLGDTEEAEVSADDVVLNYTGTDPYVACLANTIIDVGGNNNGRLDPGETVDMTATIRNIGGVDFTNLNTTLVCTDPYITITDNSGYFGYLAVDSTEEKEVKREKIGQYEAEYFDPDRATKAYCELAEKVLELNKMIMEGFANLRKNLSNKNIKKK